MRPVRHCTLNAGVSRFCRRIVSDFAGIIAVLVMVFSPFYVVALWRMLVISFVVLGLLQVVRAFKYGLN